VRRFCEDCSHCEIQPEVKNLFNVYVRNTFIHCPEDSEKVSGCLIKNIEINWANFTKWCIDNNFLVEEKEEVGTT
jgi:hypothetical protein